MSSKSKKVQKDKSRSKSKSKTGTRSKTKSKSNSKSKSKSKTQKNYPYLDLGLINSYEKLAEIYDVSRVSRGLDKSTKSDHGILYVYRKVKGDSSKMRRVKIFKAKPDSMDYDTFRTKFLNARLGQIKKAKISLYNKGGKYDDLPTKQHVVMIMNGYSPDVQGLKKRLNLLNNL
ncbi:hypothetical protein YASMINEVIRUS_611 [Yasminevirus sp. GU-2018]|uniref:Uncharacterized protein n=1 Tax=Yasminevirus sp. GU-2018 TaxID=2420051 RepID=A0A5K0U805_9VIRU|nr:hypothetical protein YASMINEVIRUS_611 [Yasminevirus sp. GU-2018]